jgi:hypothetical protein
LFFSLSFSPKPLNGKISARNSSAGFFRRYNVGGKPAVLANDPYSSVFKASEIASVIDLRNKSNFYIGLGVLQGNFVELLMFS